MRRFFDDVDGVDERAGGGRGGVRFTVLGAVRAWRDEVEVELGSPTRRALLAILLVHAGQPVVLSEIVTALWGQDPPDGAVNIIQRHVGVLRRLVDPSLSTRSSGDLLLRSSGGYRLAVNADMLDLLAFRELAMRAGQAAAGGDDAGAVELFLHALALHSGPVANGIAEVTRAHPLFGAVEREYALTVQAAADAALRAGRPERIVSALRELAGQYPYDEALQARLMLVLAAGGRQADAVEVFTATSERLAAELAIDPGHELRVAFDRINALAPPPAPPPVAPPRRVPAQLPSDLPIFTGRAEELGRLAELVMRDRTRGASPANPMITVISGMAGVGKTTLAVRFGHQVAEYFPDGQLYLNLRGFDQTGAAWEAESAIRMLLESLGITPEQLPADPAAQAALYQSLLAEQRLLLVLDNARDAEQVRPLLPGGTGNMVVITSRSRLSGLIARAGAHFVPLDVLTPVQARAFLAARLGPDGLSAEPRAAEEIIACCGGLPLALAVVAARVLVRPAFRLAAAAEELRASRGSLDAFADADPATDPRSVFSWSLRAVSPEAATMFTVLGRHPGPDFSPDAAAALIGRPVRGARLLLGELVYAHLVAEYVPGRYAQHDLLRAYAAELAERAEADLVGPAETRLLDHYLHTATTGMRLLRPHALTLPIGEPAPGTVITEFADPQAAQQWLTTERGVLLAAVAQAARTGFDRHAWLIAATLDRFLDRQGRWPDQLVLQRTALSSARRIADRTGIAHALRGVGFTECRLGERTAGLSHLDESLALFTDLGDVPGQGDVLRLLAYQSNVVGEHERALAYYATALELYRAIEDDGSRAFVLNEIGWTHILRGEHELALRHCTEAVAGHMRSGNRSGEAATWDSLGYAHHHLGDHEQAIDCYGKALTLYEELGDRALEADTLDHIAAAHRALGHREQSEIIALRAAAIFDELGHPDGPRIRAELAAESETVS